MNFRIVIGTGRVLCGLAILTMLALASGIARAEHVRVFLLGGQSNMLGRAPSSGLPTSPVNLQLPQDDVRFYFGSTLTTLRPGSGKFTTEFGPEVSFGRAIADASPESNYALIKYAAGGTSLYQDWAPGTGVEYTAFQNTVSAGLAALQAAGHTAEIVGMLWHQGENDAIEGQQAFYQNNLTAFIADVRSRYGADLPFFIGEIRRSNGPAFVTVADAQVAVAAADPNAAFIPTNDLSFLDAYHFDATSQVTLGNRFAASYIKEFRDRQTLSAGGYHVVRTTGGGVIGLGDGTYGQLGVNPSGSPATVAGINWVTDVAAGGFSTLALKSDGTVWFLGEQTLQHTTPHGTPNPVATPLQVPGLTGIDAIAAGHRHFLALDADTGNLYAWGHNGSGQVGNGGLLDVTTPVLVLSGVSSISARDGFSLAVKSDQTLWAWGRNTHGQLGLGDTADRLSPTQVPGVTTAQTVAAGGQHALILLNEGTVLAMGNNDFGQLGLGTTTTASTPIVVAGLSGVTAVSAGYFHSAALGPSGQVHVWGRNFEGQCGGGTSSPVTYPSPQILAGLSGTPTGVHCGYHFTLIELADQSIVGMGSNSDGQLDGNSVADPNNSQKILAPQVLPLSPDQNPPLVASLSPANGATGVAKNPVLVLTLDEVVQKGSGSIRIKENLDNAIIATIDIASVTINNAVVTAALPAALANGTRYYIEVNAGALLDLSGNAFAGIAGSKKWSFTTIVATVPSASLLAHYTFDVNNSGSTPDAAGANTATLGSRVAIDTTVAGRIGTGALVMNGSGATSGPAEGAVTSNQFSWANDARTLTFWWKAKTPVVNTSDGAFVSFGTNTANGNRFEVKEQASTSTLLRVEVQGTGQNTNPTSFDDGNWQFVAVTVPNGATMADVSWFVNGSATDLNTSTSTQAIATGTGPIAFGDSILTSGTNDRVPNGYLDDFQLYSEVLTQEQIQFIYQNPGSVIGTPTGNFQTYISDPALGIAPAQQGFSADPDGDGLASGLEAWFGTHPGESNIGLSNVTTHGLVTTFTHPQNEVRPADIGGYYEWSPDLTNWYACDGVDGPVTGARVTVSRLTSGPVTTVTATASEVMNHLFLRVGVSLY